MDSELPIITFSFEEPKARDIENSENWIESFKQKSSEEIMNSPKTLAEESFQSLVSTFTDLIKSKINSLLTPSISQDCFSESLYVFQASFQDFVSTLQLQEQMTSYPSSENEDLPNIVISQNPQSPVTQSSPDCSSLADEEKLESTIFRRVLGIFRRNNRSIHELYTSIDINRDGKITKNELRAELMAYDQSITYEEACEVFNTLDGDKDGYVSEEDMHKRMKFIIEKAENEEDDPLSSLIVSKPLDPDCIHGTLSISLTKVNGIKPGTRCLKFKVKDILEYTTQDFSENSLTFNFKGDYLMENKTTTSLPVNVDIDLINKGKAEGHASFNWTKNGNISNEFSYKTKVEIKTSTGQARGSASLQVSWVPIFPKFYSAEEIKKLEALKEKAVAYQKELEHHRKLNRSITHQMTEELISLNEDDSYLEEAKEEATENREFGPRNLTYMINVSTKSIENVYKHNYLHQRTSSGAGMKYLTVKSVNKATPRPTTPTLGHKNTDMVNKRVLTPVKPFRQRSTQF